MSNERTNRRELESDFWVGDWHVQPRLNRITNGDGSRRVEPKVMDVLVCLASRKGEPVTRDHLLETLWVDTFVTEDALNRSISKLRKVFDDDPKSPSVIETIPKVGYRLIPPVLSGNGLPHHPGAVSSPAAGRRARTIVYAALALLTVVSVLWLVLRPATELPSESATPSVRVVPFTSYPGREITPSLSPDGSRIAFAWAGEARDNWDIYVKQVGAETPLRLTTHAARDLSPAWSPDGLTIAFVRADEDEKGIYLTPSPGGPERKLAACDANSEPDLAWTTDGKWLAFTERPAPQSPQAVQLLSVDTLEKRQLTSPPANTPGDHDLAFSPDGKTLAFARSSALGVTDIFLLPLDGGEPKRITFDNLKVHGLAWARDGKRIVYSSNRGGSFSLWQVSADGGTPERVAAAGNNAEEPALASGKSLLVYEQWASDTNIYRADISTRKDAAPAPLITSTQWDWNPQFSPDGSRIAFISDRSGAAEVWVADREGRQPLRLTSFNGPYTSTPRWSADGRKVAFDTPAAGGNFDIYVTDIDGGPPRRLTTEPSEERAASWSRDGRWVYFASNRGGSWQVWKSPVAGGQTLQVTTGGGFAAFESVDGEWLYYTKQEKPGLWRVPARGGEEALVLAGLNPVDWINWTVTAEGVYFVDRPVPDRPEIAFFDFKTRRTISVMKLPGMLYKSGIALSPDGRAALYTRVDKSESDLIVVEHFR